MEGSWTMLGAMVDAFDLTQGDLVSKLALISSCIALLLAFLGVHYARVPIKQARRLEAQQQNRFGFTYIDRDECQYALQYYVEPDCSSVDPAGEDDLRALVASRQGVYKFVEVVLASQSKYRHVIVLAETGMGKTSLLYNILNRNYKLSEKKRHRILYIPLGRPGAIGKITRTENKGETVLLLDAFDEDTEAVLNHRGRMAELMEAASDYKRVVITCRTQFFTRDEEIPRESGVVKIGPRGAGDSGRYLLYKIYLAPFDGSQVKAWTRRRFGILRFGARRKARALIRKIPELAVRPFLLTALPDLIRDREKVSNIYELYAYMVKKWLEREERWIAPHMLEQFSRNVAVDIYCNRLRRGSERLPYSELEQHFDISVPEDGWKFRSRSLLNRDSEGNFKFAHRSIMEFMFVDAYLHGDKSCLQVAWTEFMVELFWKAIESSMNDLAKHRLLRDSIFSIDDHRTAGILREGIRQGTLKAWSDDAELAKQGKLNQYAGLFVRIGTIDGALAICDLLKNRIYIFLMSDDQEDGSRIFAVTAEEAKRLADVWASTGQFGLCGWSMISKEQVEHLYKFAPVASKFGRGGIRLWGTVDKDDVAALTIAGGTTEVCRVQTWQERVKSDPQLQYKPATAVLVLSCEADAESFFFGHVTRPTAC